MFIFIPQLGYMFAVEKNKIYDRFIKRISKQFLLNQDNSDKEDNMEQLSPNEEESLKEISITITTTNKKVKESNNNFSEGKKTIRNSKSKGEMKKMQENSKRNKSIYFSDIEEEDEEECEHSKMEDDKEDDDAEEEDNCLNNFDETMLLQNICFSNINLDFQFHNESFIYYKNEITKILDETYGDLSARITDLENAIFREISKQILKNEKTLFLFNEFITCLDCFMNLYLISEKFNLTRPIVKTEEDNTSLEIHEARNLILEYCHLGSYVKNNFSTNNKNISVISGINSSGKSCFLRQVFSSLIRLEVLFTLHI
jgi:DNA mismatch repair ATPase MutS